MPTLTLSQALEQGYSHFFMGSVGALQESFDVYELTRQNLGLMIELSKDEGEEEIFGTTPILCDKKIESPKIEVEDLCDFIGVKVSQNELISPGLSEMIKAELPNDQMMIGRMKSAVGIINEVLSEFKSYSDTDIVVTLDGAEDNATI